MQPLLNTRSIAFLFLLFHKTYFSVFSSSVSHNFFHVYFLLKIVEELKKDMQPLLNTRSMAFLFLLFSVSQNLFFPVFFFCVYMFFVSHKFFHVNFLLKTVSTLNFVCLFWFFLFLHVFSFTQFSYVYFQLQIASEELKRAYSQSLTHNKLSFLLLFLLF